MNAPRLPPRHPLVIIPSRLAATRLPRKPLALIAGEPMIVHVWRRAVESGIGPVIIACDSPEIASVIEKAGGKAILTNPDHPSGSDRIWEALNAVEGNAVYDAVINLQGDLPTIDPAAIRAAWDILQDSNVDIGTLVTETRNDEERAAPQVVKAALDLAPGSSRGRALYFSRVPLPSGEGPIYHHIGIYAYRRTALEQFVAAPPAPLEMREKLEQLRALAMGLRIDAAVTSTVPFGVDTPDDLEAARKLMGAS
ncbi:MAG: 3-deoxy-manno-octulosonate cytidylyltransferase [Pseudomonadota bacterium]|nr:3-deoxy-manno-octulosonate cytidylyltransferase [Pseudomonadota bacterium]